MNDEDYKTVDFHKWCKLCKHEKIPEVVNPCFECVDDRVNLHTDKPVKWEAKKC